MSRRLLTRILPVLTMLLGTSLLLAASASAAQGPVDLQTAGSFAVLAGSGITNTGATTVSGDIGTFPTPTETGFGSIVQNGTNHDGDTVTQGAKSDLLAAYGDAAGRKPVTNIPVELGGSTLLPGVYTSPTFGLTGTLTLDAEGNPNAEFVFQAGSTLITASNSRVVLVNGAQACQVVWQVGSSATFGTGTTFAGDVLAQTSITAQTGATFQGRLLASDGAVTLDTNTITAANCAAQTQPTTPAPVPSTSTSSPTSSPTSPAVSPSSSPTSTSSTSGPTPSPTASVSSPTGPTSSPSSVAASGGTHRSSGPHHKKGAGHRPVPSSPTTPRPALPLTGAPAMALSGAGSALILIGAIALILGRRRRA